MENQKGNKLKIRVLFFFILFIMQLFLVSGLTIKSAINEPAEVAPGDIARISIEIENELDENIENINVVLDFSSIPIAPFSSSSEQSIEELEENEEKRLYFDVIVLPEAKSDVYKIPVKLSYNVGDDRKEKGGVISLIVNAKSKIKVLSEGFLIKGRENKITIKIINEGLTDVKFLSVEAVDIGNIKINSNNYEYIGDLDSDDFDSIEYSIYIDENMADNILIPLIIRYKDSTNKDFVKDDIVSMRAYTKKEAQDRGLIEKPNYIVYIVIGSVVIIFILYRIRVYWKKRKIEK